MLLVAGANAAAEDGFLHRSSGQLWHAPGHQRPHSLNACRSLREVREAEAEP